VALRLPASIAVATRVAGLASRKIASLTRPFRRKRLIDTKQRGVYTEHGSARLTELWPLWSAFPKGIGHRAQTSFWPALNPLLPSFFPKNVPVRVIARCNAASYSATGHVRQLHQIVGF
jgi:hypothetical protein